MQVIKKLNNSAVLAIDDNGKELVAFGRGLGFGVLPYTLKDLSKIERSFYDITIEQMNTALQLPHDFIMLAADIAEDAAFELDCTLNPNLPFTLADHLHFASERVKKGVVLHNPLAYEVEHLYPKEAALGEKAVERIREQVGVLLPKEEKYSIALHIVTAELENGDMAATLQTTQIIAEVTRIIEKTLSIHPDSNSFNYSRFIMHIRFLIQRLEQERQEDTGMSATLRHLRHEYPQAYFCTMQVVDYLKKQWGWTCNEDEKLYLLMHIQRMKERQPN